MSLATRTLVTTAAAVAVSLAGSLADSAVAGATDPGRFESGVSRCSALNPRVLDISVNPSGAVRFTYPDDGVATCELTPSAFGLRTLAASFAGTAEHRAADTSSTFGVIGDAVCGDFNGDGQVLASDALGILRTAIRLASCDLCVCDTDASGSVIVATDSLFTFSTAKCSAASSPPFRPGVSFNVRRKSGRAFDSMRMTVAPQSAK